MTLFIPSSLARDPGLSKHQQERQPQFCTTSRHMPAAFSPVRNTVEASMIATARHPPLLSPPGQVPRLGGVDGNKVLLHSDNSATTQSCAEGSSKASISESAPRTGHGLQF